jgi:hypothetical protein
MAKVEKKDKKPNPAARKRFLEPVNRGGRKPMVIDVKLLAKLAESMLPVESIGIILGCNKEVLYKRYGDVLQKAREGRKKALCIVMWEKALIDKDTKMMIWLSKQHLGYKDTQPEQASEVNFNIHCHEIPK